jgi:gentisate 1,2-dioxygenase
MKTVKTLEHFTKEINARNMRGQWQADEFLQRATDGPQPAGVPYIWRWSDVSAVLHEACAVMPESLTARRNISFASPGLAPRIGTSHTIVAGIQMVMPGEIAWAHRHSLGALRFGIEGSSELYTVVDGEAMPMLPNDLVLTPRWTWHDHRNDAAVPGVWLDVLDVPFVAGAMNQTFYEPLGEMAQPLRAQQSLPFRYAWAEVEPRLHETGRCDPYDGVMLEYVNPVNGGPTLPTLSCNVQLLPAGFTGKPHRHTSSAFYYVVRGSGSTVVADTQLEWSARDCFVVPNWARHHHLNASSTNDAVLFCVND